MTAISASFMRGGMLMATGGALALPLVAATKAAEEYQHQINRMNSAGLSHKEMVGSIADAWKTTGKVITSTVTENLKVISDLRSIFGKTSEAREFMPIFAKQQGAYAAVLDGKLASRADELSFAGAKAIDMIGKVNSKAEFNSQIQQMFRATEASLGRVTPADYMTTYKYMRQAKYNLTDAFRYKVLPELILENKGGGGSGSSGGAGPQIAALYRWGVQGIINKRAGEMLMSMGMIPSASILKTTTTGTTLKGGVLGSKLLSENPLEWVTKVWVPHLSKHFKIATTNIKGLVDASNSVFKGNQLATSLVGELIMKWQQYQRFGGLYDKTDTMDQAYDRAMRNDPTANWKALGAAFENLKTAVGAYIVPVIVPAINRLATGIQQAALYLHGHPGFAKALAGLNALTSGALIAAGAINLASGAWGLVKIAAVVAGQRILGLGAMILATFGWGGVAAVVATLAVVTVAYKNQDKVMAALKFTVNRNSAALLVLANDLDMVGRAINRLLGQIGGFVNKLPNVGARVERQVLGAAGNAIAKSQGMTPGGAAFFGQLFPVVARALEPQFTDMLFSKIMPF